MLSVLCACSLVDPIDLSMASAGVCAAIMLAACQDGAAQFLAWPNRGVGVAGAIAVRGAHCMAWACWTALLRGKLFEQQACNCSITCCSTSSKQCPRLVVSIKPYSAQDLIASVLDANMLHCAWAVVYPCRLGQHP